MKNQFYSSEFERTFKKVSKLVLEHLSEGGQEKTQIDADSGRHYGTVSRDSSGRVNAPEQIEYTEIVKKAADKDASKIIARLSQNYSSAFTKAIDKWEQIQQLLEEVKDIEEEFKQEGIKEKIASLFGAKYEFATRVVKLASAYEITLSAQPKAANTVKWEAVYSELSEKLTPELVEVGKLIVKKYTTEQTPKPPSIKIVAPEKKLSEGWKDTFSGFIGKLKAWGRKFDSKLNTLVKSLENEPATKF